MVHRHDGNYGNHVRRDAHGFNSGNPVNPLSIITGFAGDLISRVFPNKDDQEKAKLALAKMQADGDLKNLEIQMSAILAEAKSNDKWTSRARPSFMYVMYSMILAAIPMGVLHAVDPEISINIAAGMKAWLAAIPEHLWTVFGVGYLGYVGGRSFDKSKIFKSKNR